MFQKPITYWFMTKKLQMNSPHNEPQDRLFVVSSKALGYKAILVNRIIY